MSKLITLNNNNDKTLLNEIFNNEILIYEDVQGSKIYVNWDGDAFIIKPKSLSAEPINQVDLALQYYYNKGVDFLNKFDDRVKSLMPKNWWFIFEYFPDESPANIEYQRMPKNGLVLTGICKGSKYEYSLDELVEFSRLFNVDHLPVIYQGTLGNDQIQALKYFLNTSVDDLEFVFGSQSFAFFFYKLLNPLSKNSFLMDDFQSNIEKIIIRLKEKDLSFEIFNPLYKRISDTNSTEFVEIYSLILINFMNYCQSINIEDIKIKETKRDVAYISLMCKLFNMYMVDAKDDILNFEFSIPDFFDKEKFKINIELLNNKTTKEFLIEDAKLEYIFKVILGSFNKKRKKPIGVFNDSTLNLFNSFVDMINKLIDKSLKKHSEVTLAKSGLLDFGDFFEIKYDVDAEGDVYPDVYTEFEKPTTKKKKGVLGGKEKLNVEPDQTEEEK